MKAKKIIAIALTLSLTTALLGCSAVPGGGGKGSYQLPDVGRIIHGFQVTARGSIDSLNAETASFLHEKSGLNLFLIENEDPELAFQICYRTPQQDGTDIPHIFEHSIIASSEKYPSTNLFFDMKSKSYHSFLNAQTYPSFTRYPLSSTSEEQFIKMMDVYMSCMEAPDVLKNEKFFQREALRLQLYDKDDPIEMTGTVFSEDLGLMMDTESAVLKGIGDTLYPGTIVANLPGVLWDNYKDLKYENLQKTYDEYYSYDNALIVLYGKLDYEKVLSFLDEEYLGDEKTEGKNALPEYDLTPVEGFHKKQVDIPAYENSAVKDHSSIVYAVDLSEYSDEEIIALKYWADFMSMDSSPFKEKLKEAGIYQKSKLVVEAFAGFERSILYFELDDANPEDADAFYEVIKKSLEEVAENGFSDSLTDSTIHQLKLKEALQLNNTQIGVTDTVELIGYFMQTGKTDYFEKKQTVRDMVYSGKNREIAKQLAEKLGNPKASCLITTIPKPGLAEEKTNEREKYLADMKAGMSEAELDKLIEETRAFDEWNENAVHNSDFLIDPKELPSPEHLPSVRSSEFGGIRFLSAPANINGAGGYELLFDTSSLDEDELYDLKFYALCLFELNTKKHTHTEINDLLLKYLNGLTTEFDLPGEEGKKDHRPMFRLQWNSMTEDLETSVNLLLEILRELDFEDVDSLLGVIGKYKESYNPATADPYATASSLAFSYMDDDHAYKSYMSGPGFYAYLNDLERKLSNEKDYGKEFAEKMQELSEKIIGKKNLIFAVTAEESEIQSLNKTAFSVLKTLPENEVNAEVHYDITPKDAKNVGVYMDVPSQFAAIRYPFGEEMKGRYYPFLVALSDTHVVPYFRFQNGAYSAAFTTNTITNRGLCYTYRDPNVSKTIDALNGLSSALSDLSLSQDDLNGYIVNTYGQSTSPQGSLSKGFSAIQYAIEGRDLEKSYERTADIRNATLEDLNNAVDCLKEAEQRTPLIMTGNKQQMEKESSSFDLILDYQKESEDAKKGD